jgi:hypothetical protein
MIEGWRSNKLSIDIRFGLLFHKALENYDRYIIEGKSHDEALEKVLDDTLHLTWESTEDHPEGAPWTPDHPTKTRENLIRSIIWYVEHFREDPAQTIILANGKPAVELSFRMEMNWGPSVPEAYGGGRYTRDEQDESVFIGERQPYILCGHLDRVVTFVGGTYVMDRKTTGSNIGSHYFDQFSPDNQMSLYTMAAKVIYQTPVRGVIIDGVQIAVGFSRFARGFVTRTDAQIEEWLGDLRYWLKLAEGYAAANYWPMNDKSCGAFGGCVFRKVCSKSPEVRQTFLESDFKKEPWNPLEVR